MDAEQEFLVEAARMRERQVDLAGDTEKADPAIQAAIDHANETSDQSPEPGSQEPGFFGLGGLSSDEIEAQKQDIAEHSYAAPAGSAPSSPLGNEPIGEVEDVSTPDEFLAAAQRVRDEQVSAAGRPEGDDPAIQAAIDYANQTAGQGPEPGSQEPGFLGLGGLSTSDIEAQQQNIAEESYRGA